MADDVLTVTESGPARDVQTLAESVAELAEAGGSSLAAPPPGRRSSCSSSSC